MPEEPYLVGEGLKLSLSVVAKGPFLNSDRVERFLKEKYEDDDVALSKETEATAKATYVFQITEVFDDLVPASSNVMLCQGTCQITIVYENKELLKHTLHSKVISGGNRKEIHRIIADYLRRSAYRESARALDRAICD